jgi:hypothetical protein
MLNGGKTMKRITVDAKYVTSADLLAAATDLENAAEGLDSCSVAKIETAAALLRAIAKKQGR